jgi:pyridoxamine 5'-phosphate oxidase-like protein
MTRWSEFAATQPSLADSVRRTFAVRKHLTMATVRRDGSPRISGTEIDFNSDGEVYLAMMTGTRRAADLRRDPRVAVHCPTVDAPDDDPAKWLGDGKIDAVAHEVEPDRFRLDIQRVVWTRVADGLLHIAYWSPQSGLTTASRD